MTPPNIKDPVLRTQVSKMLVEMQWLSQEIQFVVKQSQKDRRREDRRKSDRRERQLTGVSWSDSISSL